MEDIGRLIKNKPLRKYFLFFLVIFICAYLSLIILNTPYNDDVHRYYTNGPVGEIRSLRSFTYLLEIFFYLSTVSTDAAPFSYIISSILLSCVAVLCLKILKVNLNDKWAVACFVPVIANPYILEAMLYRFDNPFMMISLLFAVVSVYYSTSNNKRWLFIQSALLILCMFTYQPGLFAYFIIFAYKFVKSLSLGNKVLDVISKMRYWFFTVIIAVVSYFPFTILLQYCKTGSKSMFLFPYNMQNIELIANNIIKYGSDLYSDWSVNFVGQVIFYMFVIFVVNMIINTAKQSKSVVSVLCAILGIFVLALTPFSMCLLLRTLVYTGYESYVRIMYSIGILISIVLFENYTLFKTSKPALVFYRGLIFIVGLWNIVFINSAVNIIHCFCDLQNQTMRDISNDIFEITNKNQEIKQICLFGDVTTVATRHFFEEYPIMHRIVPEAWSVPLYCKLFLNDPVLCKESEKYFPSKPLITPLNCLDQQLVQSRAQYDMYVLDNKLLLIKFRAYNDCIRKQTRVLTIRN